MLSWCPGLWTIWLVGHSMLQGCVWHCGEQHGGPTEDGPVTLSVHPLHLGHRIQLPISERKEAEYRGVVDSWPRVDSVCSSMLRMFFQSVAVSAISFAVMCWGNRVRADTYRINKLIRKAGSVPGVELDSLVVVSERRILRKLQSIMDNDSHPLHDVLVMHSRLLPPCYTTEHHRKSFLPVAISVLFSNLSSSLWITISPWITTIITTLWLRPHNGT